MTNLHSRAALLWLVFLPGVILHCASYSAAEVCPSEYDHCTCVDLSRSSHNCGDAVEGLIFMLCEGSITELVRVDNFTENVGCLIISDSLIPTLDKLMMAVFPNLQALHIINSGLTEISNDAFNEHSFIHLTLGPNRLTQFPHIGYMPELGDLRLDGNMISSIPSNAFSGTPYLKLLDMSSNALTEISGSPFAGINNCGLKQVYFNNNPDLTVIENSVFEDQPISTLELAKTKISRVPDTESLRLHLQALNLNDTFELKTFEAFVNQPQFFNQTFPRLRSVGFAYHAHCCLLKSGPHYNYIPSVFGRVRSVFEGVVSYMLGPSSKRIVRQISEPLTRTCINVTSQQCIDDTSIAQLNFSNPQFVSMINQRDFCNTSLSCLDCASSLCQSNCSVNTTSSSITLSNASVLCIEVSIAPTAPLQLTPTPTVTSMTSVQMISPTPSSTSLPNCPGNDQPFTTTTAVNTQCSTVPTPTPTAPPLPYPCNITSDFEDYCQNHLLSVVVNHQDLISCLPCAIHGCISDPMHNCSVFRNIGDFCSCFSQVKMGQEEEVVETDSCNETVVCMNCSIVPDGWFRLDNNSELVCTNENYTTPPTTTQPTNSPLCSDSTFLNIHYEQEMVTSCFPPSDPLNPCTSLLNDDHYLRVIIWFVIGLAFIGNGLVILVFIVYTCIIRRLKMDYFIMHFFYFNLALADFLMCVYLLTIAAEDLATFDNFSSTDILWRTGLGCKFAGFTAILSTVLSVYVLTVITLERVFTIINAMNRRKVTKKAAFILMGIGWLLGIILASLPASGQVSDYGSVALCLPFRVTSGVDRAYVVFLLLATGVSFSVIAVSYIVIFSHIFCRKSLSNVSNNRRKTEIKVAIRMFVLVFTNFVCWFPIALVGLASVFGQGIVDSLDFAKWALVLIFPINSCLNPILYSLSTKVFRENFIIVLSKMHLCRDSAGRIVRKRAGITPSGTSQQSSSGYQGRRPTIIERIRLFSISSQGTYAGSRRGSTMSQSSDSERYRFSFFNGRRRSSVLSDSSNDDSLSGQNIRRGSSGTSIEDHGVSIQNANYRSSSPERSIASKVGMRATTKISVSSLGILPEENEAVTPIENESLVRMNPAYAEEVDNANSGTETATDTQFISNDQYPQHQIYASDSKYNCNSSEENGSGQSGNVSGSPSMDEFNTDNQTEYVHKEIDFD